MKTILAAVLVTVVLSGCASPSTTPVRRDLKNQACGPELKAGRRCHYADDQSIDLMRRQIERNP